MNVTLKNACALGRCPATKDLKACSACSEVVYCCKEHQVEHFKEGGHKMVCPGRQKGAPLTFNQCAEKAQEYYSKQMWIAALPYYSGMLELTQRVLGFRHTQVANLLNVIAIIYRKLNRIEYAISCLQKVLVVKHVTDKGTAEEYKDAFTTMGLIAELYIEANQLELAREMLRKVEEVAVKEFGENSFERGRTLVALAGCYEKSEEVEEAESHLRQALSLSHFTSPPSLSSSDLHACSHAPYNLAVLLLAKREEERLEEVLSLLNQALSLRQQASLPPTHPDITDLIALIAGVEKAKIEGFPPVPEDMKEEKESEIEREREKERERENENIDQSKVETG
mmetsp:Transcript_40094/g.40891  ORF Transcript_40094/g.40891 Transcript_40094/m.40891 type:complete len:339 (-) Transcript_40094:124-1140(-)